MDRIRIEPARTWAERQREDADIARCLTELRAFRRTDTFTGQPFVSRTGKLPDPWHVYLTGADYAVYSYQTPIAWHVPAVPSGLNEPDDADLAGAWFVPDVRYSVTTTQHQYAIRHVIDGLQAVTDGSESVVTSVPGSRPGMVRKGLGQSPWGPRRGGL